MMMLSIIRASGWENRMINWEAISGFSKREFEPSTKVDIAWDMHPRLVDMLCKLRDHGMSRYNNRFRVMIHHNGGFAVDGHSATSLHYGDPESPEGAVKVGRAVDFHCEHWSENHECWVLVPFLDQVLLLHPLLDDNGWGVGIHPDWNNDGFHLDYRMGVRSPDVWWKKDGLYRSYPFYRFSEALMDCLEHMFRGHINELRD